GKVLWEPDLDRLNGDWGRYLDLDEDGIPYRTVPGNRHKRSAYFARGTGHDEYARYTEDPEVWKRNMERLNRKFETARTLVPKPVIDSKGSESDIGIIAFGSTDPAIQEARDHLLDAGLKTDYLRLRALPIGKEVVDFIRDHKRIYVVEMNRDGQLHQLLSLEVPDKALSIISLTHNDGLPLTAKWIERAVLTEEKR
ncbi:MAG: 2-oxoacid:acceptor oxidoreductase subunit alpha, partial [Anaerolineales bacterium]